MNRLSKEIEELEKEQRVSATGEMDKEDRMSSEPLFVPDQLAELEKQIDEYLQGKRTIFNTVGPSVVWSLPVYGYGIVDRNGNPYWDESCVCQDRGPMDDIVEGLNQYSEDDDPTPYRVVRLLYQEVK